MIAAAVLTVIVTIIFIIIWPYIYITEFLLPFPYPATLLFPWICVVALFCSGITTLHDLAFAYLPFFPCCSPQCFLRFATMDFFYCFECAMLLPCTGPLHMLFFLLGMVTTSFHLLLLSHFPTYPLIKYPHRILVLLHLNFALYLII